MNFRIRPATLRDTTAVSEVLHASYSQLLKAAYDQHILDLALPFVKDANPKLLSSTTYYVGVAENGDVLGCGGWMRERPENSKVLSGLGHLRHFATHPDRCRMGVGRAIYERCEREAIDQGIETFECQSSYYAQPFYRSVGFRMLEQIKIPLGDGVLFPALRMVKMIAAP